MSVQMAPLDPLGGLPSAPGSAPGLGNRLPVGPGSRGGHWHEADYRRAYYRAWRAAHPDYRERERLRRTRSRVPAEPVPPLESRHHGLPLPAVGCGCGCGCSEAVVTVCGFCRENHHD